MRKMMYIKMCCIFIIQNGKESVLLNNGADTMAQGEQAEQQKAHNSPRPNRRKKYNGFFGCIEKRLCYIGLWAMRRGRFARRRLSVMAYVLMGLAVILKDRFIFNVRLFFARNDISFEKLQEAVASMKEGGAAAKKRGVFAVILYWLMVAVTLVLKFFAKLFGSINYVAPMVAALAFVIIVYSTLNINFALKVVYNGEEIGYIADESVFEQAQKQMLGRIVFEDYIKPDDSIPEFTIAAVDKSQLLDEDELTDELIKASGNELAQATGLYVDDKFIGAINKRYELVMLLTEIKDRYRSNNEEEAEEVEEEDEKSSSKKDSKKDDDEEEDKNEVIKEEIEFVKNVEARDGLYPVTSVIDISEMSEILNEEQEAERIYIAVAGDAPIKIAQKNGIPYSQLKALNPDIEKSLLIGQEVLVKKSVPMLEVKVVRTEVSEEEVNFKIEQIQDKNKYQGYVQITQRGKKGKSLVTSEVTYVDGIETERTVLDTRVIEEPRNEKVVVGGKMPLKQMPASAMNTSSNFIWPVAGGYVSCGINGYWGHTGMDIAAGTGTAVYASASGIVTKAAYNTTGYGYHIIISHGGGVETLYGHNSKLYVKVGDWVNQGQLIAAVGRTGRATGPHVHFEVRINGRYMNPANYVGTRCPY